MTTWVTTWGRTFFDHLGTYIFWYYFIDDHLGTYIFDHLGTYIFWYYFIDN